MASRPASRDDDLTAQLRSGRVACLDNQSLRAAAFGDALVDVVDGVLRELLGRCGVTDECAVVALGSYARRELCPNSDLDVLLVLPAPARLRRAKDYRPVAERLWYPLWDAGFVTGHAARTIKESVALTDEDLDARTALLEIRHIAGREDLADELRDRALAHVTRTMLPTLVQLQGGVELRRHKPGLISEMLEPNLKEGGGALRDIQSLRWANRLLGGGAEFDALLEHGVMSLDDAETLRDANAHLLDLRVALHRVTGAKSDVMALQDQDAIAKHLDAANADVLMHDVAKVGRGAAWIARDVWSMIVPADPEISQPLPEGLSVLDGRLCIDDVATRTLTVEDVLTTAVCAARNQLLIGRRTLRALAESVQEVEWNPHRRGLFIELLREGSRAVEVFEALDHVGLLARLFPEWERVRSLPQRNAYHHHTVDRHLLETVAECSKLLDAGTQRGPDVPLESVVARATRRPDILLLAALLHDIGKGLPEDHATIGATIARDVATRLGLDSEATEILRWLVRDHLLMADTATRRDLSDAATIERFCGSLVGDGERLRLLYLLTIGDSIATGPAAWSRSKASLLRDLFVKAAAVVESDTPDRVALERRDDLAARIGSAAADALLGSMPTAYALAFDVDIMESHYELWMSGELRVACTRGDDDRIVVTVSAPDRTGLLATVAGALTCCGLAVESAALFSSSAGVALDVFTTVDTFGRYRESTDRVRSMIERAIEGSLDVAAGVEERRRHYERAGRPIEIETIVDRDASAHATVIEVHATDQVGLLFELARTFAACGVDVALAKVATLGERVVDTFYLTYGGAPIDDEAQIESICSQIEALASR